MGITLGALNSSSGMDEGSAYTLDLSPEPESKGGVTELVEYLPPSPLPKTGDHRYVFVLLAPGGESGTGELKKPKDELHWGYGKVGKGVSEWADENGLTVVGENTYPVVAIVRPCCSRVFRSKFLLLAK